MLPMIIMVPIVQLIILVNAATFEMKNIRLGIVDLDHSSYSRKLIGKFEGSPYFIVSQDEKTAKQAIHKIDKGEIMAAIVKNNL